MTIQYSVHTVNTRQIAYHKLNAGGNMVSRPGIAFLGGFRSDMTGTKAVFLEEWCKKEGREFLRFDYSGHGSSSEEFLDGCISEWAEDAAGVIESQIKDKVILVGSSMGGWITLLLARNRLATRTAGVVLISPAPDFTEDSIWAGFNEAQRKELLGTGQVALPSDYSDDPYIITRKLIEDGRKSLVLRAPLRLGFPVRLLHGTADTVVSQDVPLKILEHADCPDMQLTLVKDADHRFSEQSNLELISDAIQAVDNRIANQAQ